LDRKSGVGDPNLRAKVKFRIKKKGHWAKGPHVFAGRGAWKKIELKGAMWNTAPKLSKNTTRRRKRKRGTIEIRNIKVGRRSRRRKGANKNSPVKGVQGGEKRREGVQHVGLEKSLAGNNGIRSPN